MGNIVTPEEVVARIRRLNGSDKYVLTAAECVALIKQMMKVGKKP